MRMPNPYAGMHEPASPMTEMKCACCGKIFVPAPYHVYRDGSKWFCKYTCYNKHLTEKENRQNQMKGGRRNDRL